MVRLNTSFFAAGERALLAAIVCRLSPSTTSDQLTAIGLFGAVVTAASFVSCNWSSAFLPLVVLGLFLNWFGDSLDGTLARHRGIERPRYGFFIDHATDLVSFSLIVVGLGCSPYFTMCSALLVLSLYLLVSSYTYLRVAIEGVHRLSYIGLGATEFRILIAVWTIVAELAGPVVVQGRIMAFAGLDVAIGALSACAFALFVVMVRRDVAQIDKESEETATVYKLALRRREPVESDAIEIGLSEPISEGAVQLKRVRYYGR